MIKLIINDIPPSNNKYLGNSHNYNIYREEKQRWEWLIREAIGHYKSTQPYDRAEVTITYYFKDRRRHDPDNYSGKFLLDPLVKNKLIKDDSFACITLRLEAYYDKKNPRTEISIVEL